MTGNRRFPPLDGWRLVSALILLAVLLNGCEAPQADEASPLMATPPPPMPTVDEEPPAESGEGEALPAELNSARAAAMAIATRPPVADAPTRVEIALHAALYRAAWQSNIAEMTGHYLLLPARDDSGGPSRPLAVDRREFRLRVLAALADLGVPVAFATRPPAADTTFFPGTRRPATHLTVRILSRDPAQATVIAEIGDATAHVGSSRQGVTAVWDGVEWILQRDPARLVW